jgi:hypothetical protein
MTQTFRVREVLMKHEEVQRYYRIKLTAFPDIGKYAVSSEAADSPAATASMTKHGTYGTLAQSEEEFSFRIARAVGLGYTIITNDSYALFGF